MRQRVVLDEAPGGDEGHEEIRRAMDERVGEKQRRMHVVFLHQREFERRAVRAVVNAEEYDGLTRLEPRQDWRETAFDRRDGQVVRQARRRGRGRGRGRRSRNDRRRSQCPPRSRQRVCRGHGVVVRRDHDAGHKAGDDRGEHR
jgi:hypothetical protein